MEPVKCADCGTWWRGEQHRCDEPATTNAITLTSPASGIYPKGS